ETNVRAERAARGPEAPRGALVDDRGGWRVRHAAIALVEGASLQERRAQNAEVVVGDSGKENERRRLPPARRAFYREADALRDGGRQRRRRCHTLHPWQTAKALRELLKKGGPCLGRRVLAGRQPHGRGQDAFRREAERCTAHREQAAAEQARSGEQRDAQ